MSIVVARGSGVEKIERSLCRRRAMLHVNG
jgi:hypothetical protein